MKSQAKKPEGGFLENLPRVSVYQLKNSIQNLVQVTRRLCQVITTEKRTLETKPSFSDFQLKWSVLI